MRLVSGTRIGLRREVAILIPVSLILLVLLSSFTLFSYRGAIDLLRDESRQNAREMAVGLVELFAGDSLPVYRDLARLSPQVVRLALIDRAGRTVFEKGPRTGADLLADVEVPALGQPTVVGPRPPDDWITVLAPLSHRGSRHFLRLDLESGTLGRQIESVRILTWVVLSVDGALAILVLLFLRHFLTPYDRLLERARLLLPETSHIEDEVAFLVSSFERAVEALHREASSPVDEIAALERTLGPNLESGLLLVGTADEALALNQAGAEILGIEVPSGQPPLEDLLGAGGAEFLSVIREATASGKIIQRRETPYDRAGDQLVLGTSINPLRRDDGSTRAFLALFADLTETLRMAEEERVASSLAQVGELAAGVAHEMRNSLATFRGYLTLVERSPDDETIKDYLVELRRETDHIQRVLEDFLSFARPESTRLETVDLGAIVRHAADDAALRDSRVAFTAVPATIKGDFQLLERAFRNLLHNAVEATSASGADEPIEVDMRIDRDSVMVSISDRGGGLPADIRSSLFQPFVTGKSDGTGMGLALAHRIVHLHGGRLSLDRRDGGGTVAAVTLPLARQGDGREGVRA